MEPSTREDEDGEPIDRPDDPMQRPPGYEVAVNGEFSEHAGGGLTWGWSCGDEEADGLFDSEAEAVDGAWGHYLVIQECKHCSAVRSWDPNEDDLEAEDCDDVEDDYGAPPRCTRTLDMFPGK